MQVQRYSLLLAVLFALLLPACSAGGTIAGDDDDSAPGGGGGGGDDDDTVSGATVEEVSLTTADGLTLAGRWHDAGVGFESTAVLLLHQYSRDRNDFYQLFPIFEREGISTLAIDFRSHGSSDDASVSQEDLLSDPNQLIHDVRAGLDFLEAQDGVVSDDHIGVMGLSVGGNMAVVANHMANGEQDWAVRTTVSLSPRLTAIYSLAGTETLDLGSGLYVAASDEQPQADDCLALEEMSEIPSNSQLVAETNAAHGIELLERSHDVREGTVAWFVQWL